MKSKRIATILFIFIIVFTLPAFGEGPANKQKDFPFQCQGFLQSKITSLGSVWGNYELLPLNTNTSWPENLISSIVFSPDGQYVLSGQATPGTNSLRGGLIKLRDVASGQEVCSFLGHTRAVNSVSFSPSGLTATSASTDGTIRLWDVASCQEIRELKKVKAKHPLAWAVDFSPTGEELLVGVNEKPTLKLLNSSTGKEITTYKIDWSIREVSFSPDGEYALSVSAYEEPSLWHVRSGKLIRKFNRQSGLLSYLFSSSGSWICGSFSPDGKYVLAGTSDGNIRLWETNTGREVWSVRTSTEMVNDVVFSSNGRLIVSTSNDSSIKMINSLDGNILDSISLTSSQDIGVSLAFSPDDTFFLVGTKRGVILRFNKKQS